MRFFHLSDLHIGKQLYRYHLKEEQEYFLTQIIENAKKYQPEAILISGDIYDKSVPSVEAVKIFDEFLTTLTKELPDLSVLLISGNHDSPERLGFANTLLEKNKIYIAGNLPATKEEKIKKVTLTDAYGNVDFYLLPFLKPGYVRHILEEGEADTYDQALAAMIAREKIDFSKRNVLLSHQFYMAGEKEPEMGGSERIYVGGLDQVSTKAVEDFDYVALGHIHRKQKAGKDHIRYCGTLYPYSLTEGEKEKSFYMVTLEEKNTPVKIEEIAVKLLRQVRTVKGNFQDIIEAANEENRDDYVSITLTDEIETYHARERLEEVYERVLEIRVENTSTKIIEELSQENISLDSPMEAFHHFYEEFFGKEMEEKESEFMYSVLKEVGGEE